MLFFKQDSTCSAFATSVATGNPTELPACFNQTNPFSPTPSKEFGRVRGFHIPPLKIDTFSEGDTYC